MPHVSFDEARVGKVDGGVSRWGFYGKVLEVEGAPVLFPYSYTYSYTQISHIREIKKIDV